MVYGMGWRVGHGIWYGLWVNGMAYGMTWRAMAWYMVWPGKLEGPVLTYRTRSQVEGQLHACSVHMYSSCSLWAVTVN